MKKIQHFLQRHNLILTFLLLLLATILSFTYFYFAPNGTISIALFYILATVMIARYTNGYFCGVLASFVSVICVNFFFTYPHFQLNFTLTGYPITFLVMTAIALITSALTTNMKHQAALLAIHEKKLMEAEKERMRANLLRAISHDLRTPLTGIIGSTTNLIDDDSLTRTESLEIAKHIYDDSTWLLNMVENLLTVTRIQDNSGKVHKSLEVVEEVVSEAVNRLKKRIPEAEIEVRVPTTFLLLPMDAVLIEQVIINLLENALVHAQSTRPIQLLVQSKEEEVSFHVIDYGIGIPTNHLKTIFDGIPGNSSPGADSQKGMGIGLSICKTIILAHDGTICAMNHGHGAEFIFTLPKEIGGSL